MSGHDQEYRDPDEVKKLVDLIHKITTRPWKIMEVCGGQTHAIAQYGIEELLPKGIRLIHGPGCPVCVTPVYLIDMAVELAGRPEVILCSYGDMVRVPGSQQSLLSAKASGGDVRILYSPIDALQLALKNPGKEVIFFAVGFETTAPATALALKMAQERGILNFSVLMAHVQVPPILEMLLNSEDARPDAFLAPGHVCAVTGEEDYRALSERYHVPMAVTGFEPVDLLRGILACVNLLEHGEAMTQNMYARVVKREGNVEALRLIHEVFCPINREWRGLGLVPDGGMQIRPEWAMYDAEQRFHLKEKKCACGSSECRAGEVLRGTLSPNQCPAFATRCTPECPLGAPMVSSEGACAAYYRYHSH